MEYSTTSFDYTPYLQPLKCTRLRSLWQEAKAWSRLDERLAEIDAFRSCFKIIRIGFSMRYVPYKVPVCGGNQNSQTRITPGFGDVAAPVQTGSDALHVVT
ncbi:hypothetical protein C2W62_46010 [Candidatus Entotheonella serta]|nr:hypothetical protein C2W62_46010 [Candidatus Entotheonella serta]